jgi:hypothetical protein
MIGMLVVLKCMNGAGESYLKTVCRHELIRCIVIYICKFDFKNLACIMLNMGLTHMCYSAD